MLLASAPSLVSLIYLALTLHHHQIDFPKTYIGLSHSSVSSLSIALSSVLRVMSELLNQVHRLLQNLVLLLLWCRFPHSVS